ncbi:MAG: hypothetical protein ACOYML_11500 [Microthrixaceae bacterium]
MIPHRLNRHGDPVFQITDALPDGEFHPVILTLAPLTSTLGCELATCMSEPVEGARSCERLAFHDGPHAFVDDDNSVVTWTQCACVDLGFTECHHVPDGATVDFVNPDLTILVFDLLGAVP